MIIQCQEVQKGFGAESVLLNVTCEIGEKERIGLIGRNGCGKSTLFRLLSGKETPDAGSIAIRRGTRIGYLEQLPHSGEHDTVLDVLKRAFSEAMTCMSAMSELERLLAASGGDGGTEGRELEELLLQYGELQERFQLLGGYEIDARIGKVRSGLGIPEEQLDRSFHSLSGGEKTKIGLAVILLEEPDLLLLDEPTNHLDMNAIDWLEQFLQQYSGTVVVISHDRYFLDRVAATMIEIEDGEAITYHTNYSGFQQEKEARLLKQFADYQEQQKKIKKMKETIKQLIEWGNRANPPNPGFHRRAASMQKALDRMEKLKRPVLEKRTMELELSQGDRTGVQVLVLDKVAKRFGDRILFGQVNEVLRYGERVALLGDNGTGKSTMLKCIMGLEQPDEGEVRLGSRVDIGYLAQEAAPADESVSVLNYFRAAVGMEEGQARGQLARFLFCGADVFKAIGSLSGGEWSRLRFALLMHQQPNLLILDEPTNHLDIDSREALEEALEDYPGTVLAVSHDRYFINRLAKRVWSLELAGLRSTIGNYEDYRADQEKRRSAVVEAQDGERGSGTDGGGHRKRDESRRASIRDESAGNMQRLKRDERAMRSSQNGAERSRKAAKGSRSSSATAAASSGGGSLQQLERDIAGLEQALVSIDDAMMITEHATDAGKLAELQHERDTLQVKLDELYEKWLKASN
ncbi:ABC-F type ribosomal protection protein [Paenibacillus sp. J5C_2022]|nr:ABC-F type ribosomal protection protein [Paenibacillus sp. J5C2022]MCU6711302.1 ABC-F type ribosomal protection protein [Paenibacillus sp. J5C2022]